MVAEAVGLATELPHVAREWAQLLYVRDIGVVHASVRGALPDASAGLWLVVLDARTVPSRAGLWLRQLPERVVLVTPHLHAAQGLASWVPSLRLVCAPPYARSCIGDVLALARSLSGGVVALTGPSQD
jgi:hypothetical protein